MMSDPATIQTRADLARFIGELAEESRTTSASWENGTLERYLEALDAWTADMGGYFRNRDEPEPSEPSWGLIALMLTAAVGYE